MLNSNIYNVINKGKLTYLEFPSFKETGLVKHCFSTRLGGVSSGIFKSMNLGFTRGDLEENVRKNFQILCNAIDIDVNDLVFSNQVHEEKIAIVGMKDRGKGFNIKNDLIGVDGLITNEKNVALVTFYADCVPLYFLDPVNKVIGLAHAGWRGTVKKIGKKMIQTMVTHYDTNPNELLAGIGPSIGGCCFEVSEDVKIAFDNVFDCDTIDKIVKNKGDNKYLINLWEANAASMVEGGMDYNNITVGDICTMCNKEDMFSHRGTGGKRGSLSAIMELKN